MSFRKERKYRLTKSDFDLIKNKLLLNGMQPLHAKRMINSIYYDSELYDMFKDSEEGLLPRKKVRIRWYDDISKANKEVKISSIEGRFKTSFFADITSMSTLPISLLDSSYGSICPSLLVNYQREYFSLETMRITFDYNIQYANYRQSRNIFYKDGECVMEIKIGIDTTDDYIESLLSFPTTRFSKYSRGMLISNGEL
jgi:hypothetical protein